MIHILLFFIAASLLLYVVLGGSDYGAGILELLPANKNLREKQKDVINHAMGPVWEANHMWLILIVVILFMGFPAIFTTLMVSLHVPMLALLGGIVVRGATFTFRHYDAVQEEKSQRVYTWLFGLSSLWTALWLGIIVASLNRGTIMPGTRTPPGANAWDAWFAPWIGIYPLAVGVFVACIFAFLASVYLIGETKDPELEKLFTRRASLFNWLVVLSGGVVFATSMLETENLFEVFFRHPVTIGLMVLATLLFIALWKFIKRHNTIYARAVAAGQVTLILLGWWMLYAPNALISTEGPMNFYDSAAPSATLFQLVLALLIGSAIIFPSLFFLLRVFKSNTAAKY